MLSTITACALALVVSLLVAAALWSSVQSALTRVGVTLSKSCSANADMTASSLKALEARITACESGLKQTSAAHLAVEVADLAGVVERLSLSTRKMFGTVFGKLGAEAKQPEPEPETREQVIARLRKDHALPRIGGNSTPE